LISLSYESTKLFHNAGSGEVGDSVRNALATISKNQEIHQYDAAVLMTLE